MDVTDGGTVTITIGKTDNPQSGFDNLPRYDQNGVEYEYRVVETAHDNTDVTNPTPADPTAGEFTTAKGDYTFTTATAGDGDTGYTSTVTNTLTIEIISLSGTKYWEDNDNRYESRPNTVEIEVYYKDGASAPNWEKDDTVTQDMITWTKDDENNKWTYTVEPLLKYSTGSLTERIYAVKETTLSYYTWAPGDYATGTRDPATGDFTGVDFTNNLIADAILVVTKEKKTGPDIHPGALDSVFTFKVYVSDQAIGDGNPGILYTGDYDVFAKADSIGNPPSRQGTAGTSGEITIKAGEKFVLRDLPTGYNYKVVESPHDDYELVAEDSTGMEGTLLPGDIDALVVNKTVAELAINNETPDNAGGKVVVGSNDPDADGNYSHEDYKPGEYYVAWLPEPFWTFGDTFKITYTQFDDPTEYTLEISDYLDASGNPRAKSQWTQSGGTGLLSDFPAIKLEWNATDDALLLTLANADDMHRKVKVDVVFVPTLAISNVTEDDEHGKVKVDGGSEDGKADGAPSTNNTATGLETDPYRALSVHAIPDSGYIVDKSKIAIRNMDDPEKSTLYLVIDSNGRFSQQLTADVAGNSTTVTISGQLIYRGDSVEIVFDPLPVPLQVDVQFITKPDPPVNPPYNPDSDDDGANPDGVRPNSPLYNPGGGSDRGSRDSYKPDTLIAATEEIAPAAPKPVEAPDEEEENMSDDMPPQTGDNTPISAVIIVGLLATAGAVLLGRKNNNDDGAEE